MKNTSTLIFRNSLLFLASLFTIFSLSATAQTKQAAARITQAVDEANLVTIRGSVNPLARAGFDQGLVADSRPMNHMLLVLQRSPQQETALRNLIDSQQVKNSSNYHAWLMPQQFGQQFGVADADIQKVADWLAQKGFTEIKASNGSMFIEFSGTAGLVRSAFHTEIHNVIVNGQLHFANLSDPQIPAALAPVVARIHSLHDFRLKSYMHLSNKLQQLKAEGKLTKPGFGTGTGLFAVGPGDLATIYNIPATVAGSPAGQGQTIAIVARSNITISDITQFGSAFGIPSLANFSTSNVIVNGPDPGIVPGDDGEATLDVDMVGSTAPNANILLVVNGGTITGNLAGLGAEADDSTDGVDQSALYIVTNNLAPVMSQSFGGCEAGTDNVFASTLWEQAAAQGISVFVSTGDSGSDSCDDGSQNSTFGLSVSGSASTPFNIAVGGTDFNDALNPTMFWNDTAALATAKSYIPEIPWNDSCASSGSLTACSGLVPATDPNGLDLTGGSGGQSNCATNNGQFCTGGYPKPSWQSAPGVPADSLRDIPDVSLFASVNSPSNHFYVFCLADSGSQDPNQPCNLTGQPIIDGVPSYNLSGVGGTSASTPAWAGIMALVNQSEVAAGRGGRQGNANYVLYNLATTQAGNPACNSTGASLPAASCTFNDITTGNNSVQCVAGTPNCSNQTASGFGILVTPGAPFAANTPAFSATSGYDLATGLGTPNVSNLIANWGNVTTNFKAATPAITSPASGTVSITHGQSQAFTITVTGAGGTPTGDISLIAEPPGFGQVGAGSATLVNGTATITTNMLPGDDTTGAGTPYPVIAHYAGDGTFGPADSQPITVTVNRENSTTTATMFNEDIQTGFLAPTTSVQFGTNYIMIVNVVGATAGAICNNTSPTSITQIPEVPCPTGNITLTENGSPLNDFLRTGSTNTNISSVGNLGFVEDLLIQLFGGVNPIVAAYSGDNSYNSSSSTPPTSITVTPGPTQTTSTLNGSSTATVSAGQSVTLVATVTTGYTQPCGNTGSGPTGTCNGVSNGSGPTGTVTFSACGTAASCTVPVVPTSFNTTSGAGAFATATLVTSFATTPPQPIKAAFTSGDLNYSNCTVASTTCSLTPLALTVSGTVGTATKLVFVAQPSNVPVGVSITPGVQVAVEDVNGNIVAGATNTVTISTNPGSAGIAGTVTGTPVKGIVTFSNLTFSAAGTGYTLNASAAGLTPAVSAAFNVILPANKLAFLGQPTSTNTGASIVPSVQVAVEDTNGSVVPGATNTITIAIGNNPSAGILGGTATATPVNGVATFPNLTISAGGKGYTLTASSAGLTGATSAPFNVLSTATTLAFITQPSNTVVGKSIAPSVQVAIEDANGSIVAGATTPIVIAIGTNPSTGTLAGTTSANPANGIATFSNLTISAAGTGYTLTASAAGLTSAAPSSPFNVTPPTGPVFTVSSTPLILNSMTGAAAASTITITSTNGFNSPVTVSLPASLPPGVTCTAPATITPPANGTATGTLSCQVAATSSTLTATNFREQGMFEAKAILLPTTDSDPNSKPSSSKGWWTLSAGTGFAALFMLFLPGGRKKFRAALGLGLVCLLGITAGCNGAGGGPVPPPKTATVTKLTANPGKVPNGTAFTFSAAVTGGTPTGSVQLFDGAAMIGTAANVSGGTAVPTAPALAVGTHAISAHYLGDATTAASASGTLNLTVTGTTTIAITTNPAATPAAPAISVTVQ
jgi:Pro-kumamolisin, activation domain/Bacterial Ig-like domain (group 3)